jgi:NAD(P)-dependent dehydrogenase (short-subunit alcohol dehydrogenase family)
MSIIIVGAGPNLGTAVARRFGREGFAVGLVSRTQSKLDDPAAQLATDGITAKGAAADIRDPESLSIAYAPMLHDEVKARGVHVAHTAIARSTAPGGDQEPDDIAELLWRHHVKRGEFQARAGVDR